MNKFLLLSAVFLSAIILFGATEQTYAVPGFRQSVHIYNSTSTVLTDYQVKIDFNSSSFDFANASSTGADIYFTDESDAMLDHWIKTFSTSGTSTIWIEVPTIAANDTTTIFMNYGDLSVTTSYSNASNTFIFYDGFDDGSITDWTGSSANLHGGETATWEASSSKYISPIFSVRLYDYANCDMNPWDGVYSIINRTLDLVSSTYAVDFNVWRQITNFRWSGTANIQNSVRVNGNIVQSENTACSVWGCTANSGWLDKSVNIDSSVATLGLVGYASDCTDGNTWYDDVRIRKYISGEPTAALEVVTISYVAGTDGSITGASVQSGFAGFNASSVTATPNTGYGFTNWSDGILTALRTDTNITTNTSVTANFLINSYTLTYSANSGGSISGSSSQIINYGSDGSTVTATPSTGFSFSAWDDGLLNAFRTDIGISSTRSFTASFVTNTYEAAYTAGANGSITGSSTQTIDYGEDASAVTATPDTGYHFVDWDDATTTNPRTDINITENISVTANFAIDAHTLSYVAGSHGSITGSTTQVINYGLDGSTVTATPNSGYRFVSWSDASTTNSRIDANITDDVSFTATFELIPSSGAAAPIVPVGIGTGIVDATIGMGQTGDIGIITNNGVNYLSYFNSNAGFDAFVSSDNELEHHHLNINNLNLTNSIVQFTIQSDLQVFNLKIGETTQVDLDGDKIKDIEVKFTNVWINRIELTIRSLLGIKEVKAETKVETVMENKYIFKRDLKLGMKGEDVKELQKFLNNNGHAVDSSGVGSPGKESIYFGFLTQKAVIKFQKANKIIPAVGYFGPITKKAVSTK